MRDPREGMDEHGCIVTGVGADRIPEAFAPIVAASMAAVVREGGDRCSLYLYGSVATGMARVPTSDVDLVAFGLSPATAAAIGEELSVAFRARCRSVELATADVGDLDGDTDRAYGNRAFLRHYCAHLSGPLLHAGLPAFPAD